MMESEIMEAIKTKIELMNAMYGTNNVKDYLMQIASKPDLVQLQLLLQKFPTTQ